LLSFVGQIVSGHAVEVREAREHGQQGPRMEEYLRSGAMWEASAENWESEFLQMFVYVVLTVFLFQRGSSESKDPDEVDEVDREPDPNRPGAPWPVRRGGLVGKLYESSLSIALFVLFLGSWGVHLAAGLAAENDERALHNLGPIQLDRYLAGPQFWFESLQNWQSEFLSIGLMVLLSVWLRQKGSPESKPVDAAHHHTGR
jgi:hypothetical protein